jgi:hypothetical protein
MEESVSQYSVTMSSITLSVASSGHGGNERKNHITNSTTHIAASPCSTNHPARLCIPHPDMTHVPGPATGLDFTRPPSSECCVHCYAAPEERDAISAHGGNRKRQETDVWRVGIVTLKLLLGHTHTHTHTCPGLVDRASGQLPLLPTGVSLELIDFLMDCLALEPSARPTAEHLLAHELFSDFSTAAPTSVSVCITDCPLDLEGPLDKGDAGGVGESLGHEGELVKGGTLDPPLIAQEVRRQSSRCRPVGVPRLEGVVWLSLTTANFASPYEATARSPCVPIRSNRLRPHTKHLASPYEATARSPCESVRSVRERPARSARDVVGVVDILRSASVVGILRGPRADGIGVRGERCLIEQRGPIGVKRRRRCYMLGVGTAWPRLPVSGV